MTSPEDDLRDLINELDGLHFKRVIPEVGKTPSRTVCGAESCGEEHWDGHSAYTWPCPTGEIVDKYKRRAHRRRYIVTASPDRNFAWGTGQPPTEYSVTIKPAGNTVHRAATPDQCHAWIEQQYEENK